MKAHLQRQSRLATFLGADLENATKEQTLAVQFEIELAKVNYLYWTNI